MFTVSRRMLVAGGGGAVLSQLLQSRAASAVTEPRGPGPVSVSHLATHRLECFSQDFSVENSVDWAAVIELAAEAPVDAGTRVVVEFDDRHFAAGKAVLFTGAAVRSVPSSAETADGRTQVSFEIDREFGPKSKTVGIGLPMTPRPLYPTENIGDFTPAILSLTAPGSDAPERFDLLGPTATRTVAPWGVEVSGAWASTEVREKSKTRFYRAPSLVRVTSIGPHPAPAGTVSITVDGSLIEQVGIEGVSLDGTSVDLAGIPVRETRVGNEMRVEVGPGIELPSGSVLEVFAQPIEKAANATVSEGLVFARAEFIAESVSERPRRRTGRGTFIDVTDSGTVEQPDAAKGTI